MISYVLLAMMIAKRFNVRCISQGQRACTTYDTKTRKYTIVLPSISDEKLEPVLTGFAWHEIAHIRHTKFDCVMDLPYTVKALSNIFEDVRVERTIMQDYPGMKRELKAVEHFAFDDAAPIGDTLRDILQYLLLRVRGLSPAAMPAIQEAVAPFVAMLEPFVPRAAVTASTQDCVDLAQEVYELLKSVSQESQDSQDGDAQDGEGQAGEGQDSQDGDAQDSQDGDAQESQNGEGQDSQSGAKLLRADMAKAQLQENAEFDVGSIVAQKVNAAESEELRDDDGRYSHNAEIRCSDDVRNDANGRLAPMNPVNKQRAMAVASQMSAQLLSMVQAYAQGMETSQLKGRVNTRSLYRLAINDSRVFARRREKPLIDTHVTLLLDGSGSMEGRKAHEASLAGYAFRCALSQIRGVTTASWVFVNDVVYDMQRNDYIEGPSGLTPLGAAYNRLLQFIKPDKKNVIICITDGEIDDPQVLHAALLVAERLGVSTYGIGIATPPPAEIAERNKVTIKQVEDLPKELFKIAGGMLCAR